MSHLTDQFETEKVGEYFGDVIDDRGDAEQRWRPAVILNNDRERGNRAQKY